MITQERIEEINKQIDTLYKQKYSNNQIHENRNELRFNSLTSEELSANIIEIGSNLLNLIKNSNK